jgi:hypothetical protein
MAASSEEMGPTKSSKQLLYSEMFDGNMINNFVLSSVYKSKI